MEYTTWCPGIISTGRSLSVTGSKKKYVISISAFLLVLRCWLWFVCGRRPRWFCRRWHLLWCRFGLCGAGCSRWWWAWVAWGTCWRNPLAEVIWGLEPLDHPLIWPLLQTLVPRLWRRHQQLSLRPRCFQLPCRHSARPLGRHLVRCGRAIVHVLVQLLVLHAYCMRNPSNERLWKVHIALGCGYQQFQLAFLFSVG